MNMADGLLTAASRCRRLFLPPSIERHAAGRFDLPITIDPNIKNENPSLRRTKMSAQKKQKKFN